MTSYVMAIFRKMLKKIRLKTVISPKVGLRETPDWFYSIARMSISIFKQKTAIKNFFAWV